MIASLPTIAVLRGFENWFTTASQPVQFHLLKKLF